MVLVAVIASMAAILVHERMRIKEIEYEAAEIRQVRRDINAAHRHITRLATLSESVIGWEGADSTRYRILRQHTDSLLQALKPYYRDYVRPAQIDTLCTLLAEKEAHLLHLTEILARQDEADSLLVNHLPEVARRATRVRTIEQKKKGIAGAFGGKKTVQVLPSAKELHQFSDSLIALQQRQTAEMDAYADSLRTLGRRLNAELNRLITELDGQAQEAFVQKERKIAEAQALSVRLFTATISAAIILLFLSYLTIHRELKHSANEKKKREKLIGELQKSNDANEKLIRLRRNLIQNVTHELRTPLTVIGGNTELLLNDTEADNRMRHAQTIGDAAGRMAGMINNLLVYFRLDSGKETPSVKPFKLRSIAETLETEFATLAKNKGLNFKTASETDEIVSGDRNRIISIGGNLLSNAIKFTRSGTVTLSTGYKNGIFTLTVAAWAEQRRTGYPKATFAQGLMDMGFHLVSRLRDDANLMYIYNGKPIGKRGRPKVYGEKIDFDNLDYSKMERIETDSEDEELYTLVAYSKAMKRNIRLVIWRSSIGKHKLYFSTDIDMSGKEVIEFYRTRFQIEFCYRDAKQYTGLYHSQARDERKLDFAFNASFTAINAAKIMMKQYDVPFSVESLKSLIFNSYLLDRFFKLSGVRPNKRINAKLVKELIDIAAYRAA